jgi:predicted nucleic acid-binding protein
VGGTVIGALDSSVLLDVFGSDPAHLPGSLTAPRKAAAEGELIACDIVWSEVAAFFPSATAAQDAFQRIGVRYVSTDLPAALAAASLWSEYRRKGGRRTRIISDFVIGAHAAAHADRLITRDRGFYRSYFRGLTILDAAGS